MVIDTTTADNYRPLRTSLAKGLREVYGIARLVASPRRDQTSAIYDLLATHNNLGSESLYLNMGYWAEATSYDAACEALAMRVASKAQLAPGARVMDAGFGFGDQDIAWARRLGVSIVGFNVTASQVEVARARVAAAGLEGSVDLRCASALETGLPDASVAAVLAVESAFHFPSRDAFFAEALRVLEPGGRLVLADLATATRAGATLRDRFTRAVSARFWQIPEGNLYGVTEYRARLAQAGFDGVEVEDITPDVFAPFGAYARRRKLEPEIRARANPLMRAIWGAPNGARVFDYVIVTARKSK